MEASDNGSGDPRRIHDEPLLGDAGIHNLRAHLNAAMQPLVIKTAKNAESLSETFGVNYPHTTWQNEILRDMAGASLILITPHWPSSALKWELTQIVELKLLAKTFVIAPELACFGDLPRRSTVGEDLRQIARSAVPIEDFKRIHGWIGYQAAYDDAIEAASNQLARERECRNGWEQARRLFNSLDLELPNEHGRVFRFSGNSVDAELVCDWKSIARLKRLSSSKWLGGNPVVASSLD